MPLRININKTYEMKRIYLVGCFLATRRIEELRNCKDGRVDGRTGTTGYKDSDIKYKNPKLFIFTLFVCI